MALGFLPSAFGGYSTQESMDTWSGSNYTLQGGRVYTLTANKTLSVPGAGTPGLTVAGTTNEPAVIFIPAGVTLTVTGAGASASVAGTPGIEVADGCGLVICGGGRLVARGGCAASGSAGSNGKDGYMSGNDNGAGGAGGASGSGGGGGAPAIGGPGGAGALWQGFGFRYGTGDSSRDTDGSSFATDGYDGRKGNAGENGVGMGQVYILGPVTVEASRTSVELAGGAAGSHGNSVYNYKSTGNNYWAGGGGGGGGGGSGAPAAYAIGGGGAGGGSGGTGGGGYLHCHKLGGGYCWAYATGGKGGAAPAGGVAGQDGAIGDASSHKSTDGERIGTSCWGDTTRYCGAPGAGGSAGTAGSAGTLYVSSRASVTGRGSAATLSAEAHPAINYTLRLEPEDGSNSVVTLDAVLSLPYPAVTVPVAREGYTFHGYFTGRNGTGTCVYDNAGAPQATTYTTIGDTTLYASWTLDATAEQKEFVVNTADDPASFSFTDDVVSLREAFEYVRDHASARDAEGLRRITFAESLRGKEVVLREPLKVWTDTFHRYNGTPLLIEGLGGETDGVALSGEGQCQCLESNGFANFIQFRNLTFRKFKNSEYAGDAIFCMPSRYGFFSFLNCRFERNLGRIVSLPSSSSATLLRCTFDSNDLGNADQEALVYAGGSQSRINLTLCTFVCNTGCVVNGNANASPGVGSVDVRNSTFVGNASPSGGSYVSRAGCVIEDDGVWLAKEPVIGEPVVKIVEGVKQTAYPVPLYSTYMAGGMQKSADAALTVDIHGLAIPDGPVSAGSLCQAGRRVPVVVTTCEDVVDPDDGVTSLREVVAALNSDFFRTNYPTVYTVHFSDSLPATEAGEIVLKLTNALEVVRPAASPILIRGGFRADAGLVIDGAGDTDLLQVAAEAGLQLESVTLRNAANSALAGAEAGWVGVSNCFFEAIGVATNAEAACALTARRGYLLNSSFKDIQGRPFDVGGSVDMPFFVLAESTVVGSPKTRPGNLRDGAFAVACTVPCDLDVAFDGQAKCCLVSLDAKEMECLEPLATNVDGVVQYYYKPAQPGLFAGQGIVLWHDAEWRNLATSLRCDGTVGKEVLVGDKNSATNCFDVDVTGWKMDVTHNSTGSYACRREPDSLVVNTVVDESSTNLNDADGYRSLRYVLQLAEKGRSDLKTKDGYVVTFDDSLYRDGVCTLKLNERLFIAEHECFTASAPLRIVGPTDGKQLILDGQKRDQVVFQQYGPVYYSNLTFQNGASRDAISAYGGALYSGQSVSYLTDCAFLDNTSRANGGGAYANEGSFTRCRFIGNTATGGSGGGCYLSRGSVSNCRFEGNAAISGGGLSMFSNLVVTSSTFMSNTVQELGGAVYAPHGFKARNCRFENNVATSGGAIHAGYKCWEKGVDELRLVQCTIRGNVAEEGGGILAEREGNSASEMKVHLANCSVLDNRGIGYGGMVVSKMGRLVLVHVTLRGNSAGASSGGSPGLGVFDTRTFFLNTILSGNVSTDASMANCQDLYFSGATNLNATGVSSLLASVRTSRASLDLVADSNCLTGGVHAAWNNAYAYMPQMRKDDRVMVDGVEQNFERPGGETWGTALPVRMSDDFSKVEYKIGGDWFSLFGGSASGGTPLATDISGRDLAGQTPSMGSYWMVKDKPTLVVDTLNDALDDLDGQVSLHEILNHLMDATSPWATNLVKNGRFDITFKDGLEGTVKLATDSAKITGFPACVFTVTGPTNRSVILDGQAKWRAFAVGVSNTLHVSNLTMTNCLGRNYGSYSTDGGGILNQGNLIVSNCSFLACSAGRSSTDPIGDGGAIHTVKNAKTLVRNVSFDGNVAAHGGALSVADGGQLTVLHSTFASNVARGGGSISDVNGGAVSVKGSTADALFANCTFVDNVVEGSSSTAPGHAVSVDGAGAKAPTAKFVNGLFCGNGTNDLQATAGSKIRLAYTVYGARAPTANADMWDDISVVSNVVASAVLAHLDAEGRPKVRRVVAHGVHHRVYPLLDASDFDAAYVRGSADWTKASYSETGSGGWKLLRGSSTLAAGCVVMTTDQLGVSYDAPKIGAVSALEERYEDDPPVPENPEQPGAIKQPTFAALVEAIQSVVSYNPAVTFATNTAVEGMITFSDQIVLGGNKTLEIHGPMTFDAQKLGRVFTVSAGLTLKLYDITFVNGLVEGEDESGAGGAILVQDGGTLYASNCIFRACSATYGGAVAQLGDTSSTTFIDCMFDANSAADPEYGNAIYHEGSSELVLEGTTIDYGDIMDYPVVVATPVIASLKMNADQTVEIWPADPQPNMYYGLAWTEDLAAGFSEATIVKWVRSNGHGVLSEPLTAPATGSQCFYRIFVRETSTAGAETP